MEESWVKSDEKSDDLLRHEQGHFDIAEVYARKFRKKLKEEGKEICKSKDPKTEIDNRFNDIEEEWGATADKYDSETKHGADRDKQKEWDEKIQKCLDELKDYAIKDP